MLYSYDLHLLDSYEHFMNSFKHFLNFKIITDSEEVVKTGSVSPTPILQFPPVVTYYVTTVQHQNQETDLGTVYTCTL